MPKNENEKKSTKPLTTKTVTCVCHFSGQRIVMPDSIQGLRNWYLRWRYLQSSESIKKFEKYIPENNTGIPYDSAIVQIWKVVHPEAASRNKPDFKGIEKLPVKPFDAAESDREVRKRLSTLQLPTTDRRRMGLYKKPKGES